MADACKIVPYDELEQGIQAKPISYGRQLIDEDDIAAVSAVLRSDWLTTGPMVAAFEEAVAAFTGAGYGAAVSSGTAALHAALHALGIGPGDEVIVPAITFVATANAVLYQGATPVFADVEPGTLLIDPEAVRTRITPMTRAIIAVDYAGQPCRYERLRQIADEYGLALVADACHSLGGATATGRVGTLADLTVFSFHPVKHITTGEGGMVVTDDGELAASVRRFRNHGIDTDHRQREEKGVWHYEMVELGMNYRLSDLQCALGMSQLAKLPGWLARRREIARQYTTSFSKNPLVQPLEVRPEVAHAFHLYVIRLDRSIHRKTFFGGMRERGIGVNVHYQPVYLHPHYRQRFGFASGLCPVAEAAYETIISLPMHHGLDDRAVARVIKEVGDLAGRCDE
ncbi:MAG: UDP-4-amino-4,6-dideoxy-N-acetyl-beta-L-altrosamine transaminase [Proteobacteria bacterium]|nr:UDP-4-amino-4,6-dideoxy-N-acetyl-beta-L-altrosamine transaminase [Pseudomonadota bacterium]MBU1687951.1 UDP-4-amino-4,6-dideoxy-N-acetyl-beta-L-altrosamine transaminase [Pseudomonadota bacterium]